MLGGSGAVAAAGAVLQKEQQINHHDICIMSVFNSFFLLAELGFEKNLLLLLISSGSFEKKKINAIKRYN